MLKKKEIAPGFTLLNASKAEISLADFKGKKNVVLYFYPRDDTPGCTLEASEFTNLSGEFARLQTVVIGVSKDSCKSHQSFIDKYNLKIELLADTEGELCERYGVWQEKTKKGETKMGIVRSTFIIDKKGILSSVEYGTASGGHAPLVLEKVKKLK